MKLAFLILTIFILPGCTTHKTPFSISSSLTINEENLKWKSFGPFNPQEAKAFIEERRHSIEDLLQPKIDPYKGEDSTPEMCKQKNLPAVINQSGQGWFFEELFFYSSEHMVLGLCANPNLLLKTRYQMLYCEKNKEVYIIQFFYSNDRPWTIELVSKCR